MSTSNVTNFGHHIVTVNDRLAQATAVLNLLTTAGDSRENFERLEFNAVMSSLWAVTELLEQASAAAGSIELHAA
jgi:hypothetical protein